MRPGIIPVLSTPPGPPQAGQPLATRALAAPPEDKSALLDRAYEDFCRRQEAGEAVDHESFCARYPAYRSSLQRLLAAHDYLAGQSDLLAGAPVARWPGAGQRRGDLTIVRELGRGGFARVYLATEASTGDRPVAVKFSLEGGAEARTLGRLAHPNVVPVLSAHVEPDTGMTAVCMPFLGSATLHDVLDRAYPKPGSPTPRLASVIRDAARGAGREDDPPPAPSGAPPQPHRRYADAVAGLGCELAEVLAFVHAHGVCHRDLKPSNVLLTPDGRPLLLDFNLSAKGPGAGRLGGTLPYMVPEQVRAFLGQGGAAPDARADLFALGVILYELLTGELPFGSLSPRTPSPELGALLLERQCAGCRPLRAAGVGRQLARLVECCLAFDPADRPAGARELAAGLRRCLPRRVWPAVACVGILCVAAATAAAWAPGRSSGHAATNERTLAAHRRGVDALRAGNYAAAEDAFRGAVELDPAFAAGWLGRGRAVLRRAAALDVAERRRLYPDVVTYINEADRCQPSAVHKMWAGYAWARMGGLPDAVRSFDQAEAEGLHTAVLYNDRAYCRLEQNDYCEAAADLTDALRLDDKLGPAYYNRALLAFRLWQPQQGDPLPRTAVDDITRALELGPRTPALYVNAARFTLLATPRDEDKPAKEVIDLLREAVDRGWPPKNLVDDPAFRERLGKDPGFLALNGPRANAPPKPLADSRLLEPADPDD